MAADHIVTITVDSVTGEFTYSPTDVRAQKNETIEFQCGNLNSKFEVMFKHRTPGDRTHISDRTPKDEGPAGKKGHLQCTGDYGQYTYGAAIYDGNNVFIDAGCGHIGVGNNN